MIFLLMSVAYATVCADGWISNSTGSGTCSHHGGIAPSVVYDTTERRKPVSAFEMYSKSENLCERYLWGHRMKCTATYWNSHTIKCTTWDEEGKPLQCDLWSRMPLKHTVDSYDRILKTEYVNHTYGSRYIPRTFEPYIANGFLYFIPTKVQQHDPCSTWWQEASRGDAQIRAECKEEK
jgi:hypothetical protein